MKDKLLECVPNFSEGLDLSKIEKIRDSIEGVKGVKILNIDIGASANRTVFTFIGEPKYVVEAAYQSIKTASVLLDMSKQKGSHPRIGATDVCPLIPVSGLTIKEAVNLSKKLASRVGLMLNIPVFLYEASASDAQRKNLANIRRGQYEGLTKKLTKHNWRPDFGPKIRNKRSGATVIGARSFLIAYNVNLKTKDTDLAQLIAAELREKKSSVLYKGRRYTFGGGLQSVKAIGWFVDEFDTCQISCNLTDYKKVGIHHVYDKVKFISRKYGIEVDGSELVGLMPKAALIEAGRYFFKETTNPSKLIEVGQDRLGLSRFKKFDPKTHLIENAILA